MQLDDMVAAFPESMASTVAPAFAAVPPTRLAAQQCFEVTTTLGPVTIPTRMHNDPPPASAPLHLAVSCLYTRHDDGRISERCARSIVESAEPWVVPFVVHLAGDYVVEILEALRERLLDQRADPARRAAYAEFLALNPVHWARTESRMVSYWSCYYRWRWRKLSDYPGYQLVYWLRSAAIDAGAPMLPAQLPRIRPGTSSAS